MNPDSNQEALVFRDGRVLQNNKIRKPLKLVLATTRNKDISFGQIVNAIYQHDATDLTHLKTFGGGATSMDLLKSHIENADHIIGDARSFDFSKYKIVSAFIEKISTVDDSGLMNMKQIEENYVGACIQNISKSMDSGSLIEMEWLPYFGLFDFEQSELDTYIKKNPFHSFLNLSDVRDAIFFLHDGSNPLALKPKAQQMATRIKSMLEFYARQNIGKSFKELLGLIYFELKILYKLIESKHIFLSYDVKTQDFVQLKKAFSGIEMGEFKVAAHQLPLKLPPSELYNKPAGFIYDRSAFVTHSFLNLVVPDIAAEYNHSEVIQYLNSIGFDASIKRGHNPHNNRHNAWMIEMRKR